MGILNVTPDSFSDGGAFLDRSKAVEAAIGMLDAGASVIDVGGESTRPGAEPVEADEEIGRVVPVVEEILAQRPSAQVSVDTMKARVAMAALRAGATMINDVSAGRDEHMFGIVAEAGARMCLMHMRGEPRTMQSDPSYGDVVAEVRAFLIERAEAAVSAGIPREQLLIDPGIGFGKTLEHNLLLLRHLDSLTDTGLPVLVGASRKSFIGATLQVEVDQRLEGSLAVAVWCALAGAAMVRVHDVPQTVRALAMISAVAG